MPAQSTTPPRAHGPTLDIGRLITVAATVLLALVVLVPLARARLGPAPTPRAATADDIAAVWRDHGLRATLTPLPPATPDQAARAATLDAGSWMPPAAPGALGGWYVPMTPFAVPYFGLTVFATDAEALAYATGPRHPVVLTGRYTRHNVVVSYDPRDAALVAPYLAALADLR